MKDYTLKLVTAPTIEPVTLDNVKSMAHIDHDVEDEILTNWIKAGREIAENFQSRSYITQTWELTFDEFPCLPILLPRSPVVSVTSVTYYDYLNASAVYPLTDLIVDVDSEPGRVSFAYGKLWPSVLLRPMSAVKIRFTCGYGSTASTAQAAVPATVKDAIMLYCAYRNENRTAEVDAVPETFFNLLRPDRIRL
jgi:uncharacterized phiE125 gp8 family phage protein